MNRRLLSVLVAGVLAGLAYAPARGADPDIRSLPLSLTAVDVPKSAYGEPSIELSAKDHVFFCGPIGIPGGQIVFNRTADWTAFSNRTIQDRGGGGDCEIAVGPDGAVYTANLQAAASAIRKSVDDGKTFDYQTSEDTVEQDRQWLATDPADGSIVYLAYHDWTIAAIVVAKSLDGGRTFIIHSVVSSDPVLVAQSGRSSIPGPIRVDPTNHLRLYMVWSIGSVEDLVPNPDCTADPTVCALRKHRTLVVGRSEDGGLTWVNRVAMSAPPGSVLGDLIPWLTVDNAGNPYVGAAGHIPDATGKQQNGMFIASSTNRGETWSAPVKVNAGAGAVVFPTLAAGNDGFLNVAWLESTESTTDNTAGIWTVRFAQSPNAHADAPSFTEIGGPVVHHGDVCTRGLFCLLGGDRTLLDFADMAIDSFGYAHVAVTSTEGPRGRHVLWWRQDSGPSAYSRPCAAAGAADCVTKRPGPRP